MAGRIPAATLEHLKRGVDLAALIESRGVRLKKRGRSFQGRCPFHDEKIPSFTVTPEKNLWHCFGCGKGGDAIRFVELMDQVSFPQAVRRLNGETSSAACGAGVGAKREKSPASSLTAVLSPTQRVKLLSRVAGFYHRRFLDRPEGLRYLTKARGLSRVTLFKDYRIGLADGSLLSALPGDAESRALFKHVGVLTEGGREFLGGCVVFPLFDAQGGNVVNLYGRRMEDGEVNHLYLPGPRTGLWNWQAAKRSRALLLTQIHG